MFHARALKPVEVGQSTDLLGFTFDKWELEKLQLCIANAQRMHCKCKGQLGSLQWGGSGAWVSRDLEYRVRPLLPGFALCTPRVLDIQGPMTPRIYAFSSPCIDASYALFMPGHNAVDLEKLGNQRTK